MNKFTAGQQFSLSFNLFQMATHSSLNYSAKSKGYAVKTVSPNHCAVRNNLGKYTQLPQFSGSFCHGRTGEGLVENPVECGGTVSFSDHMEKFSKICVPPPVAELLGLVK